MVHESHPLLGAWSLLLIHLVRSPRALQKTYKEIIPWKCDHGKMSLDTGQLHGPWVTPIVGCMVTTLDPPSQEPKELYKMHLKKTRPWKCDHEKMPSDTGRLRGPRVTPIAGCMVTSLDPPIQKPKGFTKDILKKSDHGSVTIGNCPRTWENFMIHESHPMLGAWSFLLIHLLRSPRALQNVF